MKVTNVSIANFRGVQHLTLAPGVITVIKGPNGIGKTSILDAVRSVARGGDEGDIRDGAGERRVELTLEDGTSIVRSQKVGKKPELTVSLPIVGNISKGQAFVDSLFDDVGVDPWDVILCKASERADFLKDVLAVDLPSADAVAAVPDIAGIAMPKLREVLALKLNDKMSGTEKLETLHGVLYDMRTEQNAVAKSKKASVAENRKNLKADTGMPEAPLSELRGELEQLDGQVNREVAMANAALAEAKGRAQNARSAAQTAAYEARKAEDTAINTDIDAKIKALEAERTTRLSVVNDHWRAAGQKASDECSTLETAAAEAHVAATEKIHASVAERRQTLVEQIARMEEVERGAIESAAFRSIIDADEKAGLAAEQRAKALSAALEKLDEKKHAILDAIPVKGLEIKKKLVYIDGHPFEKANTARQIEVAVEVAALRAGKSGLIVTDHGEALDSESFALLEEIARAKGLQVVVAVVEQDGTPELKVEVKE